MNQRSSTPLKLLACAAAVVVALQSSAVAAQARSATAVPACRGTVYLTHTRFEQMTGRHLDGDILMMHPGIRSRKDPWAPMREPLIVGLKERGLCFATLRDHPDGAHGPGQLPATAQAS